VSRMGMMSDLRWGTGLDQDVGLELEMGSEPSLGTRSESS
jgi:hypothetical protein